MSMARILTMSRQTLAKRLRMKKEGEMKGEKFDEDIEKRESMCIFL